MSKPSHKYLVTIPYGIGDVVYVGLAVVDQIIKNDPLAIGNIDFLCNHIQAEIVVSDPRIIPISIERELFSTQYKSSWYKIFFITHPRAKVLLDYFKKRHYDAVFPGNAAFRFIHKIGAPVMYPRISSLLNDFFVLRKYRDAQASIQSRKIVNKHFGNKINIQNTDSAINLYIEESIALSARKYAAKIKNKTHVQKLIFVAPDTTSNVTRVPTQILASVIGHILKKRLNIAIILFPSYDSDSTNALHGLLSKELLNRVVVIPAYPRPNLMFIAALTDTADVVISGDTGVMHIAATQKVIVDKNRKKSKVKPKNKFNTIAIFGGTNPGLYGYPMQTIILGRGNPEQKKVRPGLLKEGYNPRSKDYFGHISIKSVINAIDKLIGSRLEK